MRWLMIAFLVSLGALLLAAAGVARHILLHRASLRRGLAAGIGGGNGARLDPGTGSSAGQVPNAAFDLAEDADQEP
jgi:hypothetical protein